MKRTILLLMVVIMIGCGDNATEQIVPEEPTVRITSPEDSAIVFEKVEIAAEATDNKGVTKVEFFVDSNRREAVVQPPYVYLWNTLSYEDSTFHTIYAKAYDTDDNVSGSELITVMVDNSLALPVPVDLEAGSAVTDSSILLTWSPNQNDDLDFFKVFRSLEEGVTQASEQVATIYDESADSYLVRGLQENTTYYFRVYVYDTYGFYASSNEALAMTTNLAPETPALQITSLKETTVTLCWSANPDHDFSSYRLYRLLSADVDTNSTLVFEASARGTTCYSDSGLTPATDYFYRLFAVDTRGMISGSNVIQTQTYSDHALYFDGVDDFVFVANLLPTVGKYTVCAWAKPGFGDTDWSDRDVIVRKGVTGDSPRSCRIIWDGDDDAWESGSKNAFRYAMSSLIARFNAGEWHHICFSYGGEPGSGQFYWDGTARPTVEQVYHGDVNDTSNLPFYIGSEVGLNYWLGIIDEISVWNRVLSASEIQEVMNGDLVGNETGLIGFWRFNEGSGDTAHDSSPSGIDGEIHGAVWVEK